MPYVTGAAILAAVEKGSPSAADSDWADLVAAAIDAAITRRLRDETPSAELEAELARSALLDGMAAYAERRAPHGILSIGPDGDVARMGARMLRATSPVLADHLAEGGPFGGIG